jgi:Cys-rich protein (TIGR01571 family)
MAVGFAPLALFTSFCVLCSVSASVRTQGAVATTTGLLLLAAMASAIGSLAWWQPPVLFCETTKLPVTECIVVNSFDVGAWLTAFSIPLLWIASVLLLVLGRRLRRGTASMSTSFDAQGNPVPGWGQGLWALCADTDACCTAICVPCVTAGENYRDVQATRGENNCCIGATMFLMCGFLGLGPCFLCWLRARIFDRFAVRSFGCADLCAYAWLPWCALAQDRRGLKQALLQQLYTDSNSPQHVQRTSNIVYSHERAPLLPTEAPPPYTPAAVAIQPYPQLPPSAPQ